MNQQILLKIDQLLQESLPTKIIKRGNAFSIIEISDPEEIKRSLNNLSFDGIHIQASENNEGCLTLSGECYITENNFSEEEYELHVEIQNSSSLENMTIIEYLINIANKEISLFIQG